MYDNKILIMLEDTGSMTSGIPYFKIISELQQTWNPESRDHWRSIQNAFSPIGTTKHGGLHLVGKSHLTKKAKLSKGEGRQYLFFTVVTYQRRPILCLEESKSVLQGVIGMVRVLIPFPSRRGHYCQTTCIECGVVSEWT